MTRLVTVPRRFNGPPTSGNGGWVGGLLAAHLLGPQSFASRAVDVALRAPPPLDVPLALRDRAGGGVSLHRGDRLRGEPLRGDLHHDDTLVAEATLVDEFELELPPAPGPDAARAAGAAGRLRAQALAGNPYRRCFGCGIDRDDGLRLQPAPVDDAGTVATDWIPTAALADDDDGTLPATVVWTALDCPAGLAWTHRLPDAPPMMTARIVAAIDAPLRAGERYVVMGWPIAREGRKLHAGTAIVDSGGAFRARSRQLWLLPRE